MLQAIREILTSHCMSELPTTLKSLRLINVPRLIRLMRENKQMAPLEMNNLIQPVANGDT